MRAHTSWTMDRASRKVRENSKILSPDGHHHHMILHMCFSLLRIYSQIKLQQVRIPPGPQIFLSLLVLSSQLFLWHYLFSKINLKGLKSNSEFFRTNKVIYPQWNVKIQKRKRDTRNDFQEIISCSSLIYNTKKSLLSKKSHLSSSLIKDTERLR